MPRPAKAPSPEGAWVPVPADEEAHASRLLRAVTDGWTGRVRLTSGKVVAATFDGGYRRCWVDDDGEPLDVEAVELERPAPRPRSGLDIEANRSTERYTIRAPRGTLERLRAISEREAVSVNAWILEAIRWHERRSAITPKPGADDLDAGNPFDRRAER
jgi:hypothetical protein